MTDTAQQSSNRPAHIGGNANGNTVQTGDHNPADAPSQHAMLPPPERVDMRAELLALREVLTRLESPERRKIAHALSDAEDELARPEPNKNEVGKALQRTLDYARKAAGFPRVMAVLQPPVTSAAAWLGEPWHTLPDLVGLPDTTRAQTPADRHIQMSGDAAGNTICEDTEAQNVFVANLLHAAADRAARVSVILTLRSDFLPHTQRHAALNQAIAAHGVIVPAMDAVALRLAIAEPAARANQPFDTATVDLLLAATAGQAGALPLLQFALTRIWEWLAQGVAPADTLRHIGGVGGALAGEARRLYDSLSEADKARRRLNDVRTLANAFMFDVQDAIEPLAGSTPARMLVIKKALAYLDSLAQEAHDDASLQRDLGLSYSKIGDTLAAIGDTAGALEQYHKGLVIREGLAPAESTHAQVQRDVAVSYSKTGIIFEAMGDSAGALKYYYSALPIFEALATGDPTNAQARQDLAQLQKLWTALKSKARLGK